MNEIDPFNLLSTGVLFLSYHMILVGICAVTASIPWYSTYGLGVLSLII